MKDIPTLPIDFYMDLEENAPDRLSKILFRIFWLPYFIGICLPWFATIGFSYIIYNFLIGNDNM